MQSFLPDLRFAFRQLRASPGFAALAVLTLAFGIGANTAMFTLVEATLRVTSLDSPVQRGLAIGAEMVLGVVLLLGTVWLATHLAVRIFAPKKPDPGGPLG